MAYDNDVALDVAVGVGTINSVTDAIGGGVGIDDAFCCCYCCCYRYSSC